MVQVLPYVPTFGEKLVPALTEAGSNIAKGVEKRNARNALDQFMKQYAPANQTEGGVVPQPQPISPIAAVDQATAGAGQLGQIPTPMQQVNQAISPQINQSPRFDPTLAAKAFQVAEPILGTQGAKQFAEGFQKQQERQLDEVKEINKEERAIAHKRIEKYVEKNASERDTINKKREDLKNAEIAVQSGENGAFGLNSIASLFGEVGSRFISSSGAQLDASTKGLLFDALGDVTAKATNLWLEKVARSAQPGLGKTEAANETLIAIGRAKLDRQQKKIDLEDDLLQKYESLGLKPPANFDKTVNDLLRPYSEELQNKLAYQTRVIYEKEKGRKELEKNVRVPAGTPLTIKKRDILMKQLGNDPEKVIEKALELGYTIPSKQTVLGELQ